MTPPDSRPGNAAIQSVATQLDALPLTWFHVRVLALCAVAFAFDLYEIGIGNALAAVFSSPPHVVDANALSWLLASTYLGAILGASVFGWVADRHGHRRVLIGLLGSLAATVTLAAAAPSVTWLTAFRVLIGLTLGAFPPLLVAYLTDLLPPRNRGRLVFLMNAVAFLGAPAGIFLMRALAPTGPLEVDAWRWTLIVGAVGAGACAVLFLWLPESPRWLAARGRFQEAERTLRRFHESRPVFARTAPTTVVQALPRLQKQPSAERTGRHRILKLIGLCFLSPWSTAAFPLLMGAILADKGFKLTDTLLFVGVSTFGPVLGSLVAAIGVDRFDRRVALAGCALAMGVCSVAFAGTDAAAPIIVSSVAFSLIAAIYIPLLNVYGAELFETQHRASRLASAWAFNRLGAAVAPLLLVPLLRQGGTWVLVAAVVFALGASIVLLWVSPLRRAREVLA